MLDGDVPKCAMLQFWDIHESFSLKNMLVGILLLNVYWLTLKGIEKGVVQMRFPTIIRTKDWRINCGGSKPGC